MGNKRHEIYKSLQSNGHWSLVNPKNVNVFKEGVMGFAGGGNLNNCNISLFCLPN